MTEDAYFREETLYSNRERIVWRIINLSGQTSIEFFNYHVLSWCKVKKEEKENRATGVVVTLAAFFPEHRRIKFKNISEDAW